MMDIDKILLKILNDDAGKEEYSALESWKQESTDNIQLLNDLVAEQQAGSTEYKDYDKEKAWDKVNALIEPTIPLATTTSTTSETKKATNTPQTQPLSTSTQTTAGTTYNYSNTSAKSSRSKTPWIGFAVVGLLLIGLVAYFLYPTTPELPQLYKSEQTNQQFALADETQVWLKRGGSSLAIVSDFEQGRRVELKGEAYFDVAPDKSKPFYIILDNKEKVKVVGTSFNLLSDGEELDLTVYEGIVELHTHNDSVIELRQGDRATRFNGAIVKVKNTDTNKDSWKTNNLEFNNTALSQVFKTLEQHYDIGIEFKTTNSDLSGCHIRTRFTNESIEKVIKELAMLCKFKFEIKDSKVYISDLDSQ